MGWFKNVGRAISKGVKDVGHTVGKVADNKYVKGAVAAGLAATGVGAPASAAIMAGMGAAGGAMKPGGGLRSAARGAGTGAPPAAAGARATHKPRG